MLGELCRLIPGSQIHQQQLFDVLRRADRNLWTEERLEQLSRVVPDPVSVEHLTTWLDSETPIVDMSCQASDCSGWDPNAAKTKNEYSESYMDKLETQATDLRWDTKKFEAIFEAQREGLYAFGMLKVGFVRRCARTRKCLPRRQDVPESALHFGQPPSNTQLYSTSYCWHTRVHPDPEAITLREVVAILDVEGADDKDLLFWDFPCIFQYPRTDLEEELFQVALPLLPLFYIYWSVRAIVLPRTLPDRPTYMESGWTMYELSLASYCQRILYARGEGNEDVEELMRIGLDPIRMSDPAAVLRRCSFSKVRDLDVVLKSLKACYQSFVPVPSDAKGFSYLCEKGNIAWIFVSFVKAQAQQGGPFPRRQDLPLGTHIVGAPPHGRRKFVVSHGWESEVHPSPSGRLMMRLAQNLETLGASDEDVVFLDFCSNTQAAKLGRIYDCDETGSAATVCDASALPYFDRNRVAFASGRTKFEKSAFDFAMWDMGRLYAFCECEVIVLPTLVNDASDLIATFPGGSVWGMVNTRKYEKRGWCTSEFSIAKNNGRIVNFFVPEVQQLLHKRKWPTTLHEYAEMMRYTDNPCPPPGLEYNVDLGVDFTDKGDRDVVK